MFFFPTVILTGGEITGVTEIFGINPLLSEAVGTVQVTIIQLSPLGKVNMLAFGQLPPNDGGSVSKKQVNYVRA